MKLIAIFLFGACFEILNAAELPDGPLLQRAPEFARWTVTIEFAGAFPSVDKSDGSQKPAGSGSASKTTVTKTNNIYSMNAMVSDGRVWKKWSKNSVTATINPDTKTIVLGINTSGELFPSEDFSKSDFPNVAWVSAENFSRIETFQGKKCMFFTKTVILPRMNEPQSDAETSASPLPPVTETLTAHIDLDSRLPVHARKGILEYTYEFLAPPEAMLPIPEDVLAAAEKETRRAQDLTRRVPKAY